MEVCLGNFTETLSSGLFQGYPKGGVGGWGVSAPFTYTTTTKIS
ncbi:MAG: hypothetical protein QXV46_05705 [Candidatus Bathyarchaeia archaeon]